MWQQLGWNSVQQFTHHSHNITKHGFDWSADRRHWTVVGITNAGSLIQHWIDRNSYSIHRKFDEVNKPIPVRLWLQWSHSRHNRVLFNLDLNSNNFSGSIPSSIGNLSNLYWLDVANNGLSGTIPVSSGATPGLDMLVNTKHFHFGNNQLSGEIPSSLFSSRMTLIHVLFQNNQFNGSIPSTLALVQKLEVVRLDGNSLTGSVPSQFSNLTSVSVLYLSNNRLSGPIPNLSTMKYLNYVDLSNNTFDASVFPSWLSNLQSLTTIVMQNTRLYGPIPSALFNLPQLQIVSLSNNQLNGILDVPSSYGNQLDEIPLRRVGCRDP